MLDLLEATLVNAKGEHLTINQYTDPDYFYAIRGGGGSAWGVSHGQYTTALSSDTDTTISGPDIRNLPNASRT
jgi:hypothetical protein